MKHSHKPKYSMATNELFEYRSVDKSRLKLCLIITATVMVVEIIGGILTNSLALISDAGHMFTHSFALLISFGAILCASIKSCHHRTYGFFRAEVLAALFNSLLLFVLVGWILFEGTKRIINPRQVLSSHMFWVALIGLGVNLLTAWILHDSSKHDMNIKGAFLHMLADTLSSVVIVIGALVIHFTGLNIIDPILSILVAIVIIFWGWGLLKDSVNILLESAPKGLTSEDVAKVLKAEVREIGRISDMHIWTITSQMHSITLHLKLKQYPSRQEAELIRIKINKILDQRFDINHSTIEFD